MAVSVNPRDGSRREMMSLMHMELLHRPVIALRTLLLCAVVVTAASRVASAADWNPTAWRDESTLEFRTTAPGEGEHWSPVWLVVIDGQLYVRLGSRAADRILKNQTAPLIGVRIAGTQFDTVRAEAAPDKVDAVAAAMADKYTSDVLVRYFSHPLTMRLVAEASR